MITIYDHSGSERYTTEINKGSKRRFMMMTEDYITLKFSDSSAIKFELGDYVEIESLPNGAKRFELTSLYSPKYNQKTGGYDYEIRFDAYYWKWKNRILKYNPEHGAQESSFALTSKVSSHLDLIIANIKSFGEWGKYYKDSTDFVAVVDAKYNEKAIALSYSNTNIINALTEIAESCGAEWWVERNEIHIGEMRFPSTKDITLGVDEGNLQSLERRENINTYATRIYPFGSTRNISNRYRKSLSFKFAGKYTTDTYKNEDPFGNSITSQKTYDVSQDATKPIKIDFFKNSYRHQGSWKVIDGNWSGSDGYYFLNTGLEAGFYELDFSDIQITNLKGSVSISIVDGSTLWTSNETGELRCTDILKASYAYPSQLGQEWEYILRLKITFSGDGFISVNSKPKYRRQEYVKTNINYTGSNGQKVQEPVYIYPRLRGELPLNVLNAEACIWSDLGLSVIGDEYTLDGLITGKVPEKYFAKTEQQEFAFGTVNQNLLLPSDKGYYLDTKENLQESEVVEEVVVFEDIYPEVKGIVSSQEVSSEKDSDGNEIPVFLVTVSDIKDFDAGSYVINGQDMHFVFDSGSLNGLDFEVGVVKSDETGTVFRVFANENYGGVSIPNSSMWVKEGDTFSIYGIDTSYLDEVAVHDAEERLYQRAQEYIQIIGKDSANYEAKIMSDCAYNGITFKAGETVRLNSNIYFGDEGRESRVIGYEYNLDLHYDSPIYTIGEAKSYSRLGEIESKIEELKFEGKTYVKTSTSSHSAPSVYIIKTEDATQSSDSNVYSAKRTDESFLAKKDAEESYVSKTHDDTVQGNIIFEQNVDVGGDVSIAGDIDVKGDASVNGTILSNGLEIGKFIEEGDIIQGAQVTKEGVGSFAGLKSPYMQIYELILNRKTAVQGEFAFSDGDTVEGVVLNEDGTYTLTLREQYEGYMTSFKHDDIIYSNINIIGKVGEAATTGKCWMRVNSVSYDGLSLNVSLYSDDQVPSKKNILPQPYMMITRHGNETDKSRQEVWIISSEDGRMYQLTGVDSPIINTATAYATVWGKLPQNLVEYIQQHVTNFNPNQPYLYARGAVIQDLILLNYKGTVVKTENYRGAWSYETAVNDPYVTNESTYDTVTHNGSKWMVQVSNTTVEPSLTVTEWSQIVSKGESASIYEIKPTDNIIYLRGNVLSTKSLDVTIGETYEEYIELTSQDELDARGLKVQYAIDGKEPREDLEIGGTYAIGLEDGSGVIVNEEYDGEEDILMLEGESIDVSAIEDNITLYLVDTETGKDRAKYIIPVVKDGKEGKQGIQGETGRSSFTSIVFLRSNPTPSTPQGGSYDSPVPTGWSDGIPDDSEERIWMSTRIFSSDGMPPQTEEWTKPEVVSSTADMQIIFSSKETPQPPSGDYDETDVDWTEESSSETIWMAIRKNKDGIWGAWKISKIKGEKGENGTSIKVKGSLDDESQLPIPPEDASDCYIIGTDLYVWDGTVWKNVGKFTGKNGTPSTRLDLDNQNDSMLYDSDGNLLSGSITSKVTLYVGNEKIQDAQFGISNTNVEAELVDGVITVTACNAASGTVNVTCIYDGTVYTSVMSIKRIVNGARYEIVTNPTSVTYNESSDILSDETITVNIYKTVQNKQGGIDRTPISSLPEGYQLFVNFEEKSFSNNLSIAVDKNRTSTNIVLIDSGLNTIYDEEDVPLIRVKNGENGADGNDGKDGADGVVYSLQASPSMINVLTDAATGKPITSELHTVYLTYMIDGVPYELTEGDNVSYVKDGGANTQTLNLSIEEGKVKATTYTLHTLQYTAKRFTVTVRPKDNSKQTVSADIYLSYPQRGLVGPAGDAGIMLYPAGYWDANTVYTQVKDDEGKAVATPFVYYQNKQGAGDYYVLQRDLPNAGIDPSTDDSETYWKKFQKIQYLFTEALMANWARLAKSVFWGDYMFSTKGVNQAGEVVDHTAYMGTDNPMFDSETNRLTGALIPNLFLDLENGLIKTNKLSETFRPFRTYEIGGSIFDHVADRLSLNNSYNIKASLENPLENSLRTRLICMPLMSDILLGTEEVSDGVYEGVVVQSSEYEIDGVHSSVVVTPNIDYEKGVTDYLGGSEIYKDDYGWPNVCSKCVLVCSDPRIFNKYSYKYGLAGYPSAMYAPANKIVKSEFGESADMFFSVNGTLTKWLLLEAGTMAKFRLMESEGMHYWLVENAGDFEQLDVKVLVNVNMCADYQSGGLKLLDEPKSFHLGGVIGDGSYSSMENNSDYGTPEGRLSRFYGSKRLRQLYDKSPDTGSIYFLIDGENEDYIDDIQ